MAGEKGDAMIDRGDTQANRKRVYAFLELSHVEQLDRAKAAGVHEDGDLLRPDVEVRVDWMKRAKEKGTLDILLRVEVGETVTPKQCFDNFGHNSEKCQGLDSQHHAASWKAQQERDGVVEREVTPQPASPSQQERRDVENGWFYELWREEETGLFVAKFLEILTSGRTREEAIESLKAVAMAQALTFSGRMKKGEDGVWREGVESAPVASPQLVEIAERFDWQQVVLNGGPPCFHIEGERFCGRAQRWPGHEERAEMHKFVSLADLLRSVSSPAQGEQAPPSIIGQVEDVLSGLAYIADSPSEEHGGFHPNAVETAKKAIALIEALRGGKQSVPAPPVEHS